MWINSPRKSAPPIPGVMGFEQRGQMRLSSGVRTMTTASVVAVATLLYLRRDRASSVPGLRPVSRMVLPLHPTSPPG